MSTNIQLLVADWPDGDPEQDRVELRSHIPSAELIRSAIYSEREIDYGTHFVFSDTSIGTEGTRTAVCTSGPFASPGEPGTFILYLGDEILTEQANRADTFEHLVTGLSRCPRLSAG